MATPSGATTTTTSGGGSNGDAAANPLRTLPPGTTDAIAAAGGVGSGSAASLRITAPAVGAATVASGGAGPGTPADAGTGATPLVGGAASPAVALTVARATSAAANGAATGPGGRTAPLTALEAEALVNDQLSNHGFAWGYVAGIIGAYGSRACAIWFGETVRRPSCTAFMASTSRPLLSTSDIHLVRVDRPCLLSFSLCRSPLAQSPGHLHASCRHHPVRAFRLPALRDRQLPGRHGACCGSTACRRCPSCVIVIAVAVTRRCCRHGRSWQACQCQRFHSVHLFLPLPPPSFAPPAPPAAPPAAPPCVTDHRGHLVGGLHGLSLARPAAPPRPAPAARAQPHSSVRGAAVAHGVRGAAAADHVEVPGAVDDLQRRRVPAGHTR